MGTKQQEFIKFLNSLSIVRYMKIRDACIANSDLAFSKESWAAFMSCRWIINESSFLIMWQIVDDTFADSIDR